MTKPEGALSATQSRFLALHVHHLVTVWTWHFGESMLCARADKRRAYIWADELSGLFDVGLMEPAPGISVRATKLGREAAREARKETV